MARTARPSKLASSMMPTETKDDRERLRRVAYEIRGVSDGARQLADGLLDYLDNQQDERLARRDEALVNLASFYDKTISSTAKDMESDLGRYKAAAWKRRDSRLGGVPPIEYQGTSKAMLFAVLAASGNAGVPSERHIRRILSDCYKTKKVGHDRPLAMARESRHRLPRPDGKRDGSSMNAKPSDQKFITALRDSPVGVKIEAEIHARTTAERQAQIDVLAALDAKAEREFPSLEKAVQSAIASVREAEKALQAANDKLRAASYAKSGASLDYTMARQRVEQLLRAGADDVLFQSFMSEMLNELDKSRKQHEGGYVDVRNPVTRESEHRGYNNSASVKGRIAAINAAMEEAQRLRLAADQSTVAARLAELRANLPTIKPAVRPDVEELR